MTNDDFGFSKRLNVSGFKPQPKPEDGLIDTEDRIAEKHGFVSREPLERVERVRRKSQIHDTIYVRAPIETTNRFKEFCNETGLSYGDALTELMRRARLI